MLPPDDPRPLFDWTISVSNLIVIVTCFIGILWRMSKMETKVDTMWGWFLAQFGNSHVDLGRRQTDEVFRGLRARDRVLRDPNRED
jgi:hypothetical protein